MNNKKSYLFVFTSFCFVLAALALPAVTKAQGRYGNVYSKRDVGNMIARLEQSSNAFRRDFARYLDESNLNGNREEERLNRIVSDYENSLDRLRRDYDRTDQWWQSRNNVQNVLRDARELNRMMNSLAFARRLERQWRNMRTDLNKLADTFELPALDGNNNGGWNGGGGGKVPNWAVGTFYGRNPQTGGPITLTINANGSVVVVFENGDTNYASINGDRLTNNGAVSRITRINNGIRATSLDNGETIDYKRQ